MKEGDAMTRRKQRMRRTRRTVTISVYWDCVEASVKLTRQDWEAIKAGKKVGECGEGYWYEGKKYHDYWNFGGGLAGSLEVTYDGGGQGFVGKLCDAHIKERPVKN